MCSYLVMEQVSGTELITFFNTALLMGKKLGDRFCRRVFKQVALALHKLHSKGIAHRDIKPENIMITEDFKIKLIDLGFSLPL